MKPPIIRVINPNRRAVFRVVVRKLKTIESIMVALRITPEVEEFILPHHAGYIYIEERALYRGQLTNFRTMQSRNIVPRVTPHTIQLEDFNIRVGPGQMGEYHARTAIYLALINLQGECKHGVQHDLAARCVAYWKWVRKLKPKQFREHTIRR